MRSLGLIGGTSWRSTAEYYVQINRAINAHFGDNTNPPLVIANVDQAAVHRCQKSGDWAGVADLLAKAGRRLAGAGVEAAMFCASTPHKVFDETVRAVQLPFLHIGDALGELLAERGVATVGFIGTRFSTEGRFVTERIERAGVEVVVPKRGEHLVELQRIVHEELSTGVVRPESQLFLAERIADLASEGAEGVILGCTEFPAFLEEVEVGVECFDALEVHVARAVEFILSE